nr:immunoglobulin heavy chain junction region [Macaca mulatta]
CARAGLGFFDYW